MHAWGTDPVVDGAPDPVAGDGETLVAAAAATLAGIDLTVAGGAFVHRPPLPYVPGTEGAGIVLASARFKAGTPVRICGAGVGLWRDGTCAERICVPDDSLVALPEGTDPRLAAAFRSPCLTAFAAVHEIAAVSSGEHVLVTGASGAVASVAVQLAARAGARVVALSRDPERARAGVPAEVDVLATSDVAARRPAGFDVLIDTVGGELLPALVTRCVRPGGRAVLVGYAGGERATFDLPALLGADVRLLPMNLIRRGPALESVATELLAALGRGELQLATTVVALDELDDALSRIRAGTAVGRVVVALGAEP